MTDYCLEHCYDAENDWGRVILAEGDEFHIYIYMDLCIVRQCYCPPISVRLLSIRKIVTSAKKFDTISDGGTITGHDLR